MSRSDGETRHVSAPFPAAVVTVEGGPGGGGGGGDGGLFGE